MAVARRDDASVRVLFMGDAVGCALTDQHPPDGYYHLDRMLASAARHIAEIACCSTCMDARGIRDDMLVDCTHRSSLDQLAEWTVTSDRLLSF